MQPPVHGHAHGPKHRTRKQSQSTAPPALQRPRHADTQYMGRWPAASTHGVRCRLALAACRECHGGGHARQASWHVAAAAVSQPAGGPAGGPARAISHPHLGATSRLLDACLGPMWHPSTRQDRHHPRYRRCQMVQQIRAEVPAGGARLWQCTALAPAGVPAATHLPIPHCTCVQSNLASPLVPTFRSASIHSYIARMCCSPNKCGQKNTSAWGRRRRQRLRAAVFCACAHVHVCNIIYGVWCIGPCVCTCACVCVLGGGGQWRRQGEAVFTGGLAAQHPPRSFTRTQRTRRAPTCVASTHTPAHGTPAQHPPVWPAHIHQHTAHPPSTHLCCTLARAAGPHQTRRTGCPPPRGRAWQTGTCAGRLRQRALWAAAALAGPAVAPISHAVLPAH